MAEQKINTTFGLKPEKLVDLLRLASESLEGGQEVSKEQNESDGNWPGGKDKDADLGADYHLGEQIGPYKLIDVLGEGGLGIVYLAQQEKPLRRQVALKIIKPGMDSKQVIARFEGERQALALLDHENVAKVFDAGTTATGCPYFVMEYIKGLTITEYCDEEKLKIEDRLELFLCVCEAIHHAHQKGIIHRDIKPSNILVAIHEGKPVPKVIDFGVAKAITQPLTEQPLLTEQGKLIGTPEYMSPEQADIANLDIDTRSDIYSLGVLLYVLLTGVLPFDQKRLRNEPFIEIQRIIREENPPRPSNRLTSLGDTAGKIALNRCTEVRALKYRLHRELEWIPLKALRKEPERRYRSAAEFADDIRNYLHGKPLIAGPESRVYKLKKFIYRNRPLVFSVAAVLVVLAAGTIITMAFAVGQSRARAKAVKAEEVARLESEQARKAQDYAERLAYYGTIQTISAKLANSDLDTVRSMLEETDPARRGWEWGYLMGMCRLPDWTLQAYPERIAILGASLDGNYILTAGARSLTLRDSATRSLIWEKPLSNRTPWPGYSFFDPKGKFVAIVNGGSLYAYDLLKGTLIYQSEPHGFSCLCIHPQQPKLYAGTSDGRLFIFNTADWKLERYQKFSDEKIWHIAIGSKGNRLALASGKLTGEEAFVCDSNSLAILYSFEPFAHNGIRGLAILDDLKLLLVVERTLTYVCLLDSGYNIACLDGHNQDIFAISVSSDQSKVITASLDGKVNVYNTMQWEIDPEQDFEELQNLPLEIKPVDTVYNGSAVYTSAILPSGKILTGAADGTVNQWSMFGLESSEPVQIPSCDGSGAYSLDFRADGKKLAVTGWWNCNQVILFDTAARKPEYINVQGFDKLWDNRLVRFRPKSTELAVQTFGGLRFYDTSAKSNPQIRWLPLPEEVGDFIFDNSGKIVAVSYVNGGVQLLDIETGLPYPIKLQSEGVELCQLAFNSDCTQLAALGQNRNPGNVYVWDMTTGSLRFHFTPSFYTKKSSLAFHPQLKLLAVGQNNGQIALWDLESGKLIRELSGHGEGPVNSLQFSRDGTRLLSGGTDRTMRIWDWRLDKPLLTINQGWYVLSARFSPDGLSIANTAFYPAGAWIRQALPLSEN